MALEELAPELGWQCCRSHMQVAHRCPLPPALDTLNPSGSDAVGERRQARPHQRPRPAAHQVHACLAPCRDDVGDHQRWADHFGCPRVLHALEVNSGTAGVEVQLQGEGPWRLADLLPAMRDGKLGSGRGLAPAQQPAWGAPGVGDADGASAAAAGAGGSSAGSCSVDDDVELIFTPGHTSGHVCLLYEPAKALFTGAQQPAALSGRAEQSAASCTAVLRCHTSPLAAWGAPLAALAAAGSLPARGALHAQLPPPTHPPPGMEAAFNCARLLLVYPQATT